MAFDLGRPLAGLGLFLLAVRLIESAIEQASGRGFRLFIRRHTESPLQGVMSGTIATAILQSSSLAGVADPLISLVAFHSLFNVVGLALFLPVIRHVGTYLEQRFAERESTVNRHLDPATATLAEAAVEAVELETAHLLHRVIGQNLLVVEPPIRIAKGRMPVGPTEEPLHGSSTVPAFTVEYQTTKQLDRRKRYFVFAQCQPRAVRVVSLVALGNRRVRAHARAAGDTRIAARQRAVKVTARSRGGRLPRSP